MIFGGIIGKIALGVAAALFVVAGLLKLENDSLHAKLAAARGELATCGARMENILEARESDATVPDSLDGFTVPEHWLQPTRPTDN